MLEDRLTAIEQENREIRKVVTHRLNTLEQEIREIRQAVTQEEQDVKLDFPVIEQAERQQEQAEQDVKLDFRSFTCSLCSVTKPIDQREREREKGGKNQVYANSVLIIGLRNVARNLQIMEHLDMNAFVEVQFRYGD